MIQIRNLSKKYNDFYVLKDINLNLPNKGLIGISGESGSGKSTFLNALSLMDKDYEGEIIINNKNILKFNDIEKDKYHLNIGYIFQNPYLFNKLSVIENVKYVSLIKGKKLGIDDVLKKVDLLKYKNKKVNTLSGGQKQRINIASNLISKPFMLLCDEPTGSLDSMNSEKVMEVLKEISKDILVIVVSHDLDLLKKYSDDILYLKNGELKNDIKSNDINKVKYKRKNIFNRLKFIFNFTFKNILTKRKRTLLTSFMISFGIIGMLFSILIKDGFSSYFSYTFKEYEANKYVYCYKMNENEFINLENFKLVFKDYKNGYTYHYDFKDNKDNNINKIYINEFDSFLNFNNLRYIKEVNKVYKNNQIGLRLNEDYLKYYYALFNVSNLDNLNKYLKNNEVNLKFNYYDSLLDISFNLRLMNIEESKYISFIHSDSSFLYEYIRKDTSLDLESNKIKIIPYIINKEEDKNDLYLNDKLKSYEYLFDNKIYDENYTFVFNSSYCRLSSMDVNMINELIDSNYYFSINNGINMMGYFNDNISFLNKEKIIKGSNISFIPTSKKYNSVLDIDISKGLYNLLKDKIYIQGFEKEYLFKVNEVIDNNDLVIYQSSEWSIDVFKSLFNFKDYELVGVSIAFSNNDDLTIDKLKRNFSDYEFICPLKEMTKEIDSLIEKIQLILMVLSSFCIIMSILLMVIIVFINTIEEEKIISILRIYGISKKEVIFIFLFESILIGLISLIISYYSSIMFSMELNVVFNMLIEEGEIEFITLKKDTIINVFMFVMFMSILSSFIPSLIASKKNSLKVLRS